MTAYYNEFNKDAAEWLEELIRQGHIAPGHVDTRSIEDVRPNDLRGYTQCHLFAGIGLWSYALRRAGWPDDRPVWTGSCPCQPFSAAGKGAAFADERHLWPAFHQLIKVCQPASLVGEQVASAAVDDWIDLVQADMEALGYAFGSVPFPSAGVGAPHIRDRNFWMAHSSGKGSLPRSHSRVHRSEEGARAWDGELERPGAVSRLADTDSSAGREGSADVRGWPVGGDAKPRLRLGRGGMPDGMGDTCIQGLAQRERERGILGGAPRAVKGETAVGTSIHADRLADAGGQRCDGVGLRIQPREPRQDNLEIGRHGEIVRSGPTNGFWRDADWLGCRDGKWRPVEPGSFPLAYGLPAGMGKLLPGARRLAGLARLDAASLKRAKSHRIIGLRGAGNAINAEAAIAWIKTVMECIG